MTMPRRSQRSARPAPILVGLYLLAFVIAVGSSGSRGALAAGQSVLTQHNDNQRTGANIRETQLTPANVSQSFGFLYKLEVKGDPAKGPNTIGAQPLFVSRVVINGTSHEVLYVATRQNFIFAFDVGVSPLIPGPKLLWKIELTDPAGRGAEELPGMEARYGGDSRIICQQTRGPVGIASTPVIDQATNTMYVVYRTASRFQRDPNNPKIAIGSPGDEKAGFFIRKVDIRTGATLGQQQISVPGDDPRFDANKILNRTGLLLLDGVIYLGFGGAVCDTGGGDPNKQDPHGWILAVDASSLKVIAGLVTTPNSSMGGVWQSGSGLAADHNGFVYALTGNNENDKADKQPSIDTNSELSNAILRVHLNPYEKKLVPMHFTANNWYRLDTGDRFPNDPLAMIPCQPLFPCDPGTLSKHVNADSDLGSGGAVVLRNGLVLGGGKQGRFYLINPGDMTVKQSFQAFHNSWHPGISPCDYDQDQAFGPNIHGAPVVWHPQGVPYSLVYHMPEKDYVKAYRAFDDGHLEERPFLTTYDSGIRSPRGMPGGALSLSAAGGSNGVLWVSVLQQPSGDGINTSGEFKGRLIAFDALTLAKLWEADDQVPFAKFIPPTIGGGKVFRSAYADYIYVYGLTGPPHPPHVPGLLPTRPVTAVWRDRDHLDLFMTGRDQRGGSVLSTNWEAVCPPLPPSAGVNVAPPVSRGWTGWFPVDSNMDIKRDDEPLPGLYSFLAPGASPVTAAWRPGAQPPHLDLFVAGSDGRVMSIVWQRKVPSVSWPPHSIPSTPSLATLWQAWFPVAPNSISVAPRQPITAVWRNPNHLDLFVVDTGGRVMSTYFEGDHWQSAWFPVNPQTGIAAPGQSVTALWRDSNHLDLFITGRDGRIMSTYFESNHWQPAWFPVNPQTGIAAPGQSVTALWRNSNHLDLFITGRDGRVMSTYFESNHWQPAWFPVNPPTGTAAPGQTVTALWRNSNHLDLFITGRDGRIMSTYFEGNQWQPGWFAINPQTGIAAPGQAVTAVWSNPDHLDLFITARDGRVMSIFFDHNHWSAGGWFGI
jgi:hypothetical protein